MNICAADTLVWSGSPCCSAIAAASLSALAQQPPKPEQLIKWRQSAFQVVAWNSARIKASVDGNYNKDEVIKAANTIAAIANTGLVALFPSGTEQGKGWHDTSAKPELFQDGELILRDAAPPTDVGGSP